MTRRSAMLGLGLVLLTTAASAVAIIRRHDRDDRRYLDLGMKYPAVTRFGGGTATLIERDWLITAAHVAANLSPFDTSVELGGELYEIEGIARHPESDQRPRLKSVDIALVKLKAPVSGVQPVDLYEGRDEAGRPVVFVGIGMFGDGLTGPQADDGKRRGATNSVTGVVDNWIMFKFDVPSESTDLEGISGPGDSGGPALLEVDGKTYVIGVSSANDDAGAEGPCRYNSTEYYARVSPTVEWIRATMKRGVSPVPAAGQALDLRASGWPQTPAGRTAAAFFEAYGRGDDQSMQAFESEHRADSALRDRPMDERVQSWRKYRDEWGALKPRKLIEGRQHDLYVLVNAKKAGVWMSFRFMLEQTEPHKLLGIDIARPVSAPRD